MKASQKNLDKLSDELKSNYSETEYRVMTNSLKFKDLPEMAEKLSIAMELLIDRWSDIVDLEEYMESGQWQADYEADERGEIRNELPRGVLSQDALYNTLQELNSALKDLKRIASNLAKKTVN